MPFQTKRFLRNKIMQLEYRIKDLEERLCPCESHTFKKVGTRWVHLAMSEIEPVYRYKCMVCGKEKEDII